MNMKKKYFTDLPAKKSLGQNFLVNQGVLEKIAAASNLKPADIVLEVGPGKGALTEKLASGAGKVIAIEKDRRLIDELAEKFSGANVEIKEGDIMETNPGGLGLKAGEYKLVANIPYYITSNLLRKIFEEWPRPALIVLMVQKEVAERIMAGPPDMNLLALSVQFFAEPEIIAHVSRGSFRPTPNVDSAVIRLTPKATPISKDLLDKIFAVAKKAFAGKRKQLKNTVGQEILLKAGIDPRERPEKLSLADWLKIGEVLK